MRMWVWVLPACCSCEVLCGVGTLELPKSVVLDLLDDPGFKRLNGSFQAAGALDIDPK